MNHWLQVAAEQRRARMAPLVSRLRCELAAASYDDARRVLGTVAAELAPLHHDDAEHVRAELRVELRRVEQLAHEMAMDRHYRRTP